MTIREVVEACRQYLYDYGWECRDEASNRVFYKEQGEVAAAEKNFQRGQPNTFVTVEDVASALRGGFANLPRLDPLSVSSQHSDTVFTSAGVQQYLDNSDRPQKGFIEQPVVRSQYFKEHGQRNSDATSFVNACTLEENVGPEGVVEHLDQWLTVLSNQGLWAGDMLIREKTDSNEWGERSAFDGLYWHVEYRGVEVGDIGYLHRVPERSGTTDLCDAGFGLERIAWCCNKSSSLYDAVFPGHKVYGMAPSEIDALRTATLVAAEGITPSNKGAGQKLRRFVRTIDSVPCHAAWEGAKHFYSQWSEFQDLPVSPVQTIDTIFTEAQREATVDYQKENSINVSIADNANDYILKVLDSGKKIGEIAT